jgi:type I restriction enzyme, S subunit
MEVREPSARYLLPRHLTDLGELPVDWRVVPLDEFEPFVTSGSRGWAAYYSDSGAVFLRITNLSRDCIYPSLDDLRYVQIPADNSEGSRTALAVGDVLISITADIGIVGLVTRDVDLPAYINQHIALVRFDARPVDSRYVAYYLAGAASQKRLKAMTDAGAKAGMNLTGVRQVLAAFPPTTTEQAAISQALTDADTLIDSLEQLLTKKRQIKQGAMQELLTGKRQLPGFDQPWATARLEALGTFLKGSGVTRDEALSGDLPCVRYGEIYTAHSDHIRAFESWISAAVAATATRIKQGDLLFAGSGETKEEIGKCVAFLDDFEAYAGGDIVVLRPTVALSPVFMGYAMNLPQVVRQKASLGQGDAVVHVSAAALAGVTVSLPAADEQLAIAQVLSDIDADLFAIEARLAKARDLKQAMMQVLLTGRIRLVESETA